MTLDYKRIGMRIKKNRKILKITQAELSEKVYLSTEYISQIERGVRHLSLDSIANIAIELDTSVDSLLFGTCFSNAEKSKCENKSFSEYSKIEQDVMPKIFSAIKTILHEYNIDI